MSDKPTIEMFSKSDCPYCDTVRAFFAQANLPDGAVVEEKLENRADREALYDSLGLVGRDRFVPQIVLTANGERYRISGADGLRQLWGIQSLFGAKAVSLHQPAVAVRIVDDAGATEAGGPSCCE